MALKEAIAIKYWKVLMQIFFIGDFHTKDDPSL